METIIDEKGAKAIHRAGDLLYLLQKNPPGMMLGEIAHEMGLPKATVHRILQALSGRQLVRSIPGKAGYYCLGVGVLALSRAFLEGFSLVREANPYLYNLNQQLKETVHLGTLDATSHWVVYLDKIDSPQVVRMFSRVGQFAPVHCTAIGKAMLACLPDDEIRAIFSDYAMRRYTEHTLTRLVDYLAEVSQTRQKGYALDRCEYEAQIFSIGASIADKNGQPVAGISVTMPIEHMAEPEKLHYAIEKTCETARLISELIIDIPNGELK